MTRRDFFIKWLVYALALLPVVVLGVFILPRIPILGTVPALLPVAAITVAVLEGPVGGAGFGLFVGILADALIPGVPGTMTFALSLLGGCCGAAARYGVSQNLLGCLICSGGSLLVINLVRVAVLFLRHAAPLWPLVTTALGEIFWSLVFLPLIYGIFLWVVRRVPKATVF